MVLTVDAHVDVPWMMTKQGKFDLQEYHPRTALDFPRMKKGGLQAAVFALYLSDALQDVITPQRASTLIDEQITTIKAQHGCALVDYPAGAYDAYRNGLVPIFLGLEGGRLLHEDLSRLRELYSQGVRYLTVTHNSNTTWADSATDQPCCKGLTKIGLEIIQEAERLGVLIDVSHASDATCYALLHASTKPMIASHSGCRALVNHPRNLSDDLITQITKDHGVVHIPFAKAFIGAWAIADHIDHVVQLTGSPLHVGIGSDLDGAVLVDGAQDVSCWYTACGTALLKRGYALSDIEAITGGNTLRLLS